MNVLMITHHRLVNQWSGATSRIRRLAQELAAQGAQVTVLALISPRLKASPKLELGENCEYFEFPNPLQWVDGFSSRLGFPAYSFTSYLNRFLPLPVSIRRPFDVVISESPFLWTIAKRVKSRTKVLSTHNHELTYHDHYFQPLLYPLKWTEKKALKEADLVVAVSKEDRLEFERIIPQKPICLIENGFDRHSSTSVIHSMTNRSDPEKYIALFLASHSVHNLKALNALVQIFSNQKIANTWCLWVVGSIAPSFKLPRSVLTFGPQDDLAPFFQNAKIALNPVLSGSGSNLKLIESLGNACPVLTTPIGARGFSSPLRGLYIESLHNFEGALLNFQGWEKPNPEELVAFQWRKLGMKYYQQLDSLLKLPQVT